MRVDDTLYLHAIVNRGCGNVIWTEIWRSDDSGVSWMHMGADANFPAHLHGGYAQCWSWDYDPDDGWVYVVSTGFQRNKGIILMRVRPRNIGDRSRYLCWGYANERWRWGDEPTPYHTRRGEVGGADASGGWRRANGFSADSWRRSTHWDTGWSIHRSPTCTPPRSRFPSWARWDGEDHLKNQVAQLYGGYVLPGSRFDIEGGIGLVVSQWNTATGWPYRTMQFKAALKDTTRAVRRPEDPINL